MGNLRSNKRKIDNSYREVDMEFMKLIVMGVLVAVTVLIAILMI